MPQICVRLLEGLVLSDVFGMSLKTACRLCLSFIVVFHRELSLFALDNSLPDVLCPQLPNGGSEKCFAPSLARSQLFGQVTGML